MAVDHVVLERGRLAERWRSERWDSLRLLTPNWATRLPLWGYTGADPDGFMTATELVSYFEELPDGGVLVVGASASGVQLADELARAGREVLLAVGSHTRVPRCYRGSDIYRWLEQIGMFANTADDVPEGRRARLERSLPLIGRADGRDVDLPALQRVGVRLAGRLVGAEGGTVSFADDLKRHHG